MKWGEGGFAKGCPAAPFPLVGLSLSLCFPLGFARLTGGPFLASVNTAKPRTARKTVSTSILFLGDSFCGTSNTSTNLRGRLYPLLGLGELLFLGFFSFSYLFSCSGDHPRNWLDNIYWMSSSGDTIVMVRQRVCRNVHWARRVSEAIRRFGTGFCLRS